MRNAEELVRIAKESRVACLKRSLEMMPRRTGSYYLRRRRLLKLELEALEHELLQYELFNQGDTVR